MAVFLKHEIFIAFRYLRGQKNREKFLSIITVFSCIGIMLGVATLIIVMSVMNGFRGELISRIVGLKGHIFIEGYRMLDANSEDLLQNISEIRWASPMIVGKGFVSAQGNSNGVMIQGISVESLKKKPLLVENILEGSVDDLKENHVFLGKTLAASLGVKRGDNIILVSPRGHSTPLGTFPAIKKFYVAAIFDTGFYEHDVGYIYMTLEMARLFLNYPKDYFSYMEILVQDPMNTSEVMQKIQDLLTYPAYIYDWKSNQSLFDALEVERNVMFIILFMIILVAAFNIISTMIMLVIEKTREIGILRTIGFTRYAILRIFFIAGFIIGLLGSVLGVFFGVVVTYYIENIRQFLQNLLQISLFPNDIYLFSRIPAEINFYEVGMILIIALSLSFFATLYPAWKASRLTPVEALRRD